MVSLSTDQWFSIEVMLDSLWFSWLLPTLVLLTWFYFFSKRKYSYWSAQGIQGPTPIPLIGNLNTRTFRSIHDLEIEWMQRYGKIYGVYNALEPRLVIIEADLIKQVLIKDFQHFMNRLEFNFYHEMWSENLLMAKDDNWRRIRTIATPAFTTGKLRAMRTLMNRSVDKLVEYLDTIVNINGHGVIQTKEAISAFTIDVIASTAFATETGSIKQSNTNPVVVNGRKFFNLDPLRTASIFLFPKPILELLEIEHFFDPKVFNFFTDLTRHIVRQRREGRARRDDLVQLLSDACVDEREFGKIGNNFDKLEVLEADSKVNINEEEGRLKNCSPVGSVKKSLTEAEIIAQCIFFLVAGFETTTSALTHCIFELVHNPQIQERLYQELLHVLGNFNKKKDQNSVEYYEAVMSGAPYLEAVIKETLRKYPSATQVTRLVGTDGYKLNGITLFKGQEVDIPVSAVHHCPDYYPNPEQFNPDRFMPEYRHLLVPYTYLPFGLGPRNCVGVRFAFQEMKLCLAALVLRYQFCLTPKTPNKLTFKASNVLLNVYDFPIKVIKRL